MSSAQSLPFFMIHNSNRHKKASSTRTSSSILMELIIVILMFSLNLFTKFSIFLHGTGRPENLGPNSLVLLHECFSIVYFKNVLRSHTGYVIIAKVTSCTCCSLTREYACVAINRFGQTGVQPAVSDRSDMEIAEVSCAALRWSADTNTVMFF